MHLYPVGGGWMNTISFTFPFARKALTLISFNIGQFPDIVSMNSTLKSVNGNVILFSSNPASKTSSSFCRAWYIFRVFSAKTKKSKSKLTHLCRFPSAFTQISGQRGIFFVRVEKLLNSLCMRNNGVDLDVRDICVWIGNTGLGVCDICTGDDICLHGCVALRNIFDLVVVLLYFAPFDSQQIVFY